MIKTEIEWDFFPSYVLHVYYSIKSTESIHCIIRVIAIMTKSKNDLWNRCALIAYAYPRKFNIYHQ